MYIFIDESALNPVESGFLFRRGTLNAFSRITAFGHIIGLPAASLSAEQQAVLKQEEIDYRDGRDNADLLVSAEEGQLILSKAGKKQAGVQSWKELLPVLGNGQRKATLNRKTSETDISIEVNLDGTGKSDISTGLNFYNHMLEQISRHGLIDLKIHCDGDLEIDEHHTIEDVAIALGEAISTALGTKKGIERYGFILPMDEAQARVALDLSGRPYLVFKGEFKREYVGDLPTEMVEHFFYSLAMNLKATIHVDFEGNNDHHNIEACFKGLARALKSAIERNERIRNQIPSSKGTL